MSKKELKKEIQSLKDDIRILVERRDFIKVQEVEFRWRYLFLKEEFIWGTPLENTEATETLFCDLTEKQIQEKLDEHHRFCIKNNPWFNSSKKPTSTTVEDDGIHFWNHIKMKDDGTFVEAPKHEEEKKLALMNELKKCSDSPYYFMTKYYQVNGKLFTTILDEQSFNAYFKAVTNK